MTKKRFIKYVPDSYGYTYITTIIGNEKNKHTGNIDEIVDMLNELHEENQKLKELFLLILKKLGRTNIQCDFCKFGEFYEYYENHGKDITHEFICHKGHGNYTHTISLCPDWKIEVEE